MLPDGSGRAAKLTSAGVGTGHLNGVHELPLGFRRSVAAPEPDVVDGPGEAAIDPGSRQPERRQQERRDPRAAPIGGQSLEHRRRGGEEEG